MSYKHKAGDGILWIQPDGPGTKLYPLGCHNLGDLSAPRGDVTVRFCPDLSMINSWYVSAEFQGAPTAVTTSVEADVEEFMDWLERVVECGAPLYVNKYKKGRRDVFPGYTRGWLLPTARITGETLSNLYAKDAENQDMSMQSFDISSSTWLKYFRLVASREETTETEALNDIDFGNAMACWDECGGAKGVCEDGAAAGDPVPGSASSLADVLFKTKATDWTAGAANPFATDEIISSIVRVQIDDETMRVIVARGTTDAANPAEIAYSDDNGATWNLVNVGATLGQYVARQGGLFALDPHNVWCVLTGGGIAQSTNGGESWTVVHDAILTTEDLNMIHGPDENHLVVVGDNDTILVTIDGGVNWYVPDNVTGSGDDLYCVAALTDCRWWIGTGSGNLYKTIDAGETAMTLVTFSGSGAGEVVDIEFVETSPYNLFCGYLVHNTAAPVGRVFHTVNGGYDWRQVAQMPTNAGLNAIAVCDCNQAKTVGEVQGTTAMIANVGMGG